MGPVSAVTLTGQLPPPIHEARSIHSAGFLYAQCGGCGALPPPRRQWCGSSAAIRLTGVTAPAFDTVIVPDFRSPQRIGRFEPQTLLFLASWMEHAGEARHWPVHLACIDQPPESVRALAEPCGATISVHESLEQELGRFSNKLRAWDVKLQTDQLLYLDADMLCLGPPIELANRAGSLAGAPAGLPRVPESHGRSTTMTRCGLMWLNRT